jgi:hypothetical protein
MSCSGIIATIRKQTHDQGLWWSSTALDLLTLSVAHGQGSGQLP